MNIELLTIEDDLFKLKVIVINVGNYCISVLILVAISLSLCPLLFLSLRANNPKGLLEVREALEKVHKVEDLLPIMKVSLSSKSWEVFLENKTKQTRALFKKNL